MAPRLVATIAAITSLVFGIAGLAVPGVLAAAVGIDLDPVLTAIVRLVSASYLGYALLAWLVRDVTDPAAWRAVAGANAVSWALSAVVLASAFASGLGEPRGWALVAMQVVFAGIWALTYVRRPNPMPQTA